MINMKPNSSPILTQGRTDSFLTFSGVSGLCKVHRGDLPRLRGRDFEVEGRAGLLRSLHPHFTSHLVTRIHFKNLAALCASNLLIKQTCIFDCEKYITERNTPWQFLKVLDYKLSFISSPNICKLFGLLLTRSRFRKNAFGQLY